MAEVLIRFTEGVKGPAGDVYSAQACGGIARDGLWEGWIEFVDPNGSAVRTPRETEQPNRNALVYWAEGLTAAYLEGALRRAIDAPRAAAPGDDVQPSLFPGPKETVAPRASRQHAVLDPFATYEQGEGVLRSQLLALSTDHLSTLIDAYRLNVGDDLPATKEELAERIIRAVKRSSSAV